MIQVIGLSASTYLFLNLSRKYPLVGRGRRPKWPAQLPGVQQALRTFFIASINPPKSLLCHDHSWRFRTKSLSTLPQAIEGVTTRHHTAGQVLFLVCFFLFLFFQWTITSQVQQSSGQTFYRTVTAIPLILITCSSGNHVTYNLVSGVSVPARRNTGNSGGALGCQAGAPLNKQPSNTLGYKKPLSI